MTQKMLNAPLILRCWKNLFSLRKRNSSAQKKISFFLRKSSSKSRHDKENHRHEPFYEVNFPSTFSGFSFIELLICMVIIGIFSSIAVPAYEKHINRARLLQGLTLAESVKLNIEDKALTAGFDHISNNASAEIGPPETFANEFIESLNVLEGGKIQVRFLHPEGNLMLSPLVSYGVLKWICTSETETYEGLLPPGCTLSGGNL